MAVTLNVATDPSGTVVALGWVVMLGAVSWLVPPCGELPPLPPPQAASNRNTIETAPCAVRQNSTRVPAIGIVSPLNHMARNLLRNFTMHSRPRSFEHESGLDKCIGYGLNFITAGLSTAAGRRRSRRTYNRRGGQPVFYAQAAAAIAGSALKYATSGVSPPWA